MTKKAWFWIGFAITMFVIAVGAFSVILQDDTITHTFNIFDRGGNLIGTFHGDIDILDTNGEVLQFSYDGQDYLVYAYYIDNVSEVLN